MISGSTHFTGGTGEYISSYYERYCRECSTINDDSATLGSYDIVNTLNDNPEVYFKIHLTESGMYVMKIHYPIFEEIIDEVVRGLVCDVFISDYYVDLAKDHCRMSPDYSYSIELNDGTYDGLIIDEDGYLEVGILEVDNADAFHLKTVTVLLRKDRRSRRQGGFLIADSVKLEKYH